MSSVPKIVIRPRTSSHQNAASSSAAATPASQVDSAPEGDDDDVENDDSQAMDVDQEGPGPGDDNENAQGQDEDASESFVGAPTPRPRGRPRGRGRGSTSAVSTPRARGRGRGRGRPRGRPANSLLIRLPKRNDDETEAEAEAEGENDADVEGGDAVEEHEPEKEAPLGGGKPFRKIHGEVYVIDGDEFITPEDPKGNEKIDQFGNLLGGRRFKAATFALPNRHPQRQYMLAIDAARTSGFRDSLYYFRRNLLAFKLNATQPEKDYLISEGKLGSHLRTRSVTLVTARSAFKLHGSKMIIDGRWVTDDYYEDKVLEEITARGLKAGELVGELPDPNATHHNNELSALNATAAAASSGKGDRGGGGGGGIYRAGGPTTIFGGSGWGPYSDGPLNAVRKSILSRDGVSEDNWMWMMATRVDEANEMWTKQRKEALKVVEGVDGLVMGGAIPPPPGTRPLAPGMRDLREEEEEGEGEEELPNGDVNVTEVPKPKSKKRKVGFEDDIPAIGVYEPHGNLIHYRGDTQPVKYRWEALPDSPTKRRVLGGTKVGNGAWALAWVDTVMEFPDPAEETNTPEARERQRLLREAENSALAPIDLA
ncbi:chromatin remodelling complex Rsc7/Swp82 subunit-domain-containing protein [Gymnopilus junonius]|uniref:Chromatin remodelling complex Rsc7/Swp82 subunit-domain-containing protein n=1 Tax=Gymnopilus junonius TaxID=109634 RepID=A0A9P5NB68_GYMJU|nr:chromatin remodelling complex Rsc7/Swp82 subunit-domain-containing protein [Gymnopilus junonius]